MIFTGRHLGFFRIRHIGMTQYLYKCKYRCRHQNYDSMSIRSTNIAQMRFSWRLLKKNGRNPYHVPRLTTLTTVPGSPWSKSRVVVVHGDQFWPMGHLCQLLIEILLKIKFAEVKMTAILNFAWILLQVILKPFPIDLSPWKPPYWTFWSSKLANWFKTECVCRMYTNVVWQRPIGCAGCHVVSPLMS